MNTPDEGRASCKVCKGKGFIWRIDRKAEPGYTTEGYRRWRRYMQPCHECWKRKNLNE